MAQADPPKSPTLLPPRKSTELEDPGAHDLESSNDEEDVFTDAQDSITSPTVPTTRVEKVDDNPSHGQVPGTAAYEMRTQDAVPDEVAVVPDGLSSKPESRRGSAALSSPGGSPIPKMVVEKVDDVPSHGEVPGTHAHAKRTADAIPDSIVKAQEEAMRSSSSQSPGIASPGSPIPRTVVTRVDSDPRHGEVPGTDAYKKRTQDAVPDLIEKSEDNPTYQPFLRSSYFTKLDQSRPGEAASPLAADGGFGPMDYDEDDNEDRNSSSNGGSGQHSDGKDDEHDTDEADDGFADDFDDFEEGAAGGDDDFGDFDDGFANEELEPQSQPKQPTISTIPPFPVPDFSESQDLSHILSLTDQHLNALFPETATLPTHKSSALDESSSAFLADRSLQLWSQLVAPPELQPPNWVRSRIRRLFLVSLGVPVDLDEILPKSKQKKLVLNYTSSPTSPGSAPQGAAARLRNDADNASDSAASNRSGTKGGVKKGSRRRGPTPPPEFNLETVKALCDTTDEALEGFSTQELQNHLASLNELVGRGKEVLQYWVRRKEAAVGEKEAFDGVIENLVRHAQRVRK